MTETSLEVYPTSSEPGTRDLAFLTPQEIADELRVGEWTIHGMIKRGELPVLKVGSRGHPRIPRDAFEAWKRQHLAGT